YTFGFQPSSEPDARLTAAALLRDWPLTIPKCPPKYTVCPENAIVNTTGWQRGGQANPVTWPTVTFQLTALPAGVTSPILAWVAPPRVPNAPPAKMLPFGPARTT